MGCVNLIGSGLLSPLGMYPRQTVFVGGASQAVDRPGAGTMRLPFKTIRYAVSVALIDTLVVVAGGHTEDIDQNNWAWNAQGIWVRGQGWGGRRPTLTFTTSTGARLEINQSSCVLENLLFLNDVNGLVNGIQGARLDVDLNVIEDVGLRDIEYRDLADKESVTPVAMYGNRYEIDGLKIIGNVGQNLGSRGIIGNVGGNGTLKNFYVYGDYPNGLIRNAVGPELGRVIDGGEGSYLWSKAPEDVVIRMDQEDTGFINGPIRIRLATDTNNVETCIRDQAASPPRKMQHYNTGANIIGVVNADGESELGWVGTPSVDE